MGTSAKALKLRIKSVQSTEHITRAMQLVASSKLRKATDRVEKSRSYFDVLQKVFSRLASGCGEDAPKMYFQERKKGKICLVVIGGDRGLAGGYNNNVFTLTRGLAQPEEAEILPIGKKTYEYFSKKGYSLVGENLGAENVAMEECARLGRQIVRRYREGVYTKVYLVYTSFKNMISQNASVLQMLPLSGSGEGKKESYILCEPSPSEVFEAAIPEYVSGLLYCGVCDSCASEQAARRNAMDNATKNADEMIEKLGLQYNRARQGAITQEITEIVAGSEQ